MRYQNTIILFKVFDLHTKFGSNFLYSMVILTKFRLAQSYKKSNTLYQHFYKIMRNPTPQNPRASDASSNRGSKALGANFLAKRKQSEVGWLL